MDKIDMVTLKSLIVELKDSGLTLQEVADKLQADYGIVRTRQAIGGLYNRAKEAMANEGVKQLLISDVVNIYCMCDSASQVYETMKRLGYSISYRNVLGIINNEGKYIESVKVTIIANIVSQLDTVSDIRDLIRAINFKGIQVSRKRFNEYLEEASRLLVRQHIIADLNRLYQLTLNKDMVRNLAESFNTPIKTADLRL